MPQEYVEKINAPVRDTTQLSVSVIGVDTFKENELNYGSFDVSLGNWDFNKGVCKQYVATYALNGMRIGDANCKVESEGYSDEYERKYCPQTIVTTRLQGIRISSPSFNGKYRKVVIGLDSPIDTLLEFLTFPFIIFTNPNGVKEYANTNNSNFSNATIVPNERDCRIRLTAFMTGLFREFNNHNVTSLTHLVTSDLISATLPMNKLTVSVLDRDGEYDPANPNGDYEKFNRGDRVIVRYGYEGYMMDFSTNFISDIPTYDNDILTITAVSKLDLLTNGVVLAPTGTLGIKSYDVTSRLSNILARYGVALNYDDGVNTTAVVNNLSLKELVQLVANANANYISVDGEEITFKPISDVLEGSVVPYNMRSVDMKEKYPKVSMTSKLGSVKYASTAYVVGDAYVTYDCPDIYDMFELPDEYSAAVKVEVEGLPTGVTYEVGRQSEGIVYIRFMGSFTKLSGLKLKIYLPTTKELTNIYPFIDSGDELPISNPLITDAMDTSEHANVMFDVYKNRQIFEVDYSQDFRLELGDVITIDTKYETNVNVVITELEYQLPGRFGRLKGRRV